MSGMNSDAEQALDLYIGGRPATPEQLRHARLSVCDHAADAADARGLLEMIGLVDPAVPVITHAQRKQLLANRRLEAKKIREAAAALATRYAARDAARDAALADGCQGLHRGTGRPCDCPACRATGRPIETVELP